MSRTRVLVYGGVRRQEINDCGRQLQDAVVGRNTAPEGTYAEEPRVPRAALVVLILQG